MTKEQFTNQFVELMRQQNTPVQVFGDNAVILSQSLQGVNVPLGQMYHQFEQSGQPDMAVRQFINQCVEYEKNVRNYVDSHIVASLQQNFPGCYLSGNGVLGVFDANGIQLSSIDMNTMYYEFLNAPNGRAIMERNPEYYDIKPFLNSRLGPSLAEQQAMQNYNHRTM